MKAPEQVMKNAHVAQKDPSSRQFATTRRQPEKNSQRRASAANQLRHLIVNRLITRSYTARGMRRLRRLRFFMDSVRPTMRTLRPRSNIRAPVIEHYRTLGRFIEMDGDRSIGGIAADIVAAVDQF